MLGGKGANQFRTAFLFVEAAKKEEDFLFA